MQGKSVSLVGGVPQFDLTVMDFERWGMHSAAPRLRQVLHDGMNIMDRCEIYAKPVPGREHHKAWFQDIDHPDMRLMAAAPELLDGLIYLRNCIETGMQPAMRKVNEAISKAQGCAV